MATTVVNPRVGGPTVVVPDATVKVGVSPWQWLKSLGRRIANRGRRMFRWLGIKSRNGANRVVEGGTVMVTSTRRRFRFAKAWTKNTARNTWGWATMAVPGAFRWVWNGITWTGDKALQGVGYVGFAISVAYAYITQAAQASVFATAALVVLGFVLVLQLLGWLVDGYREDAALMRWLSFGRKRRAQINAEAGDDPLAAARAAAEDVPLKRNRGNLIPRPTRFRWVENFAMWLTGEEIELQPDPFYGEPDATPEQRKGAGLTLPEAAAGDPRMDVYEGMTLQEILDRHNRRLTIAIKDGRPGWLAGRNDISYWNGRIFFLEAYTSDPSCDGKEKFEALYHRWRDSQPAKSDGGLVRGDFRQGMQDERKLLREQHEVIRLLAPTGGK